jgi:transcriptional regulator with XRE-family HTH domain
MWGVSKKRRDPEVVLRRLGDAVRGMRDAKKVSQEQVAFTAGVSVRHFQKVEAGVTNPAFLTLLGIADALDVPVSELLTDIR